MTAEPARWLLGEGADYERFMARWMADHPGDWHRCGCGNWTLGGKTDPCAQCPPAKKAPKRPTGWSGRQS